MARGTNVSTLLDANLEAGRATKVAAITDDGSEVAFAELFRQMCAVACRFSELGIGREDRVLLVLDDTPAFPASFLGAMRVGAVPIPANFLARADDFAYFLDDSYAAAVVVDAPFLDKVEPFVAARSEVALIVANGASDVAAHSLDQWMAAEEEIDPIETHPEDMAFWLYSSGSTGRPKGVVHTHADLWHTCDTYAKEIIDTSADDIHFSTTKMFHAYGLGNSLSFPLWSGATSVYMTGR
ncbi:MAG: AMP-binding protein, partial [Acidimicrobiia bacterium]|nr:AMP-binding protein [Acidimicrobiia bacterium]